MYKFFEEEKLSGPEMNEKKAAINYMTKEISGGNITTIIYKYVSNDLFTINDLMIGEFLDPYSKRFNVRFNMYPDITKLDMNEGVYKYNASNGPIYNSLIDYLINYNSPALLICYKLNGNIISIIKESNLITLPSCLLTDYTVSFYLSMMHSDIQDDNVFCIYYWDRDAYFKQAKLDL